jgi:hypothetical protein
MTLIYEHERKAIAQQIKDAIDEYCRVTYDDGHRSHLGASMIGDVCNRRLWYGWRWVQSSKFGGRMQRLFNRGHKTEDRFIEWLTAIGVRVWSHTEDGNQFRISAIEKHYGGSLDSIGQAPEWLGKLAQLQGFLIEYKTHNEKSFGKLVKDGVKKSKPRHWVQMCVYGQKYGFQYAVYCAINKNDDDLHIEIVELDWNVGTDAERKAEYVITSQVPPARYSETITNFECQFCDLKAICHQGAPYEVNCRSCNMARPVANGEWHCGHFNAIIPKDFIPKGCQQWRPVGRNR